MARTRASLLVGLVATLALAAPVAAQQAGGGWRHGGGEMRILRSLGLSTAQQTQVQQLVQAARAQMQPLTQQLGALHEQLATAVLTASTTGADLQPLVQQETQLRSQLETARYALLLQIRDVLTPAQLSQAATMLQQLASLHSAERSITGGQ
jgi:Spy/CpxP family protein refolding chaperone